MYGVRHDISHEFPEFEPIISRLKRNHAEFTRLLAEYDDTDKKIYGLEQQQQPVADSYVHDLKRKRLVLKDQLYSIIKQQATAWG